MTLAHYEQHVDEFRGGTRDHDVSQNIAWLLITAAAPQQLSPFSTVIHTEVFYGKKPITLDIA